MERELPDVGKILEEIERSLEELKNPQRVGKTSLKGYKTSSDDLYDWSYLSSTDYKKFRLIFRHANAKNGAIMKLKAFYSIDNPDVMANVVEGFGVAPDLLIDYELEQINPETTTWIIAVLNNTYSPGPGTPLTGYVKFFFDGSDTGEWEIENI